MTVDIYNIPGKKYYITYPCKNTSSCHPVELRISQGTYRFELWGAGKWSSGGYVKGEIHLFDIETTLYLYIGGIAPTDINDCGLGGYNGGGNSTTIGKSGAAPQSCRSFGGNGATDIRFNHSLESRILVAGGSGGGSSRTAGGFGGGFVGGDGNFSRDKSTRAYGGSQTDGGRGYYNGSFGIGAKTDSGESTDLAGGGGGGWYGGGSGYDPELLSSGAGGSSFINGNSSFPFVTSEIYRFFNSQTIAGDQQMPIPKSSSYGSYLGNGCAVISCIDPISTCKINSLRFLHSFSLYLVSICILYKL